MSRWQERFQNFQKALRVFEEVCEDYNSEKSKNSFRLAVIQSFEIIFELSWKLMKDYLKDNGINLNLPREVIKEAFSSDIIVEGQLWIDMLQDRNSTTHEYNQEKADIILDKIVTEYKKQFEVLEATFKGKL